MAFEIEGLLVTYFTDPTAKMLHLVGLGLADETDITVRGLEIVKRAERVYLEAYTAILLVDKAKLVSLLAYLFKGSYLFSLTS